MAKKKQTETRSTAKSSAAAKKTPAPAQPTISLCMIVKDEADLIEQCVKSVQPIISEVIVVDTGSTDATVEIAKKLGAKVFHRPWDDDFSAPRNLSLEQATGDWILVLDADEVIAQPDLDKLRSLTADRKICWEFLQRHYSNDHRLSEYKPVAGEHPELERDHAGYFESNLVRLFPNREGITYRGRVHELVEHSIREIGKHEVKRTDIRIHHYGHTDEVRMKKEKSRLYTPLGQAKLLDDPKHWQAYFEMGVEHNQNGRYNESVMAFISSLVLMPEYVPTWINMGYVLCEMGKYKMAEFALRNAIELDPRADEAYCNLGVVYMRCGKPKEAEEALRAAIRINPRYVNALCNLGKTLVHMQRMSEAVVIYKRALEEMPKCAPAKADLGAIYLSARVFEEAERYLESAVADDPRISRAYFHLAQIFKMTNRAREAVNSLERFYALEEKSPTMGPPQEQQRIMAQVLAECKRLKGEAPHA